MSVTREELSGTFSPRSKELLIRSYRNLFFPFMGSFPVINYHQGQVERSNNDPLFT